MRGRALLRTLVVIALALLVQTTVVLDIRVGGAAPNVMLLLPIAAGVVAGPIEGAGVGFVAGLALDLLTPTPLGMAALVGTLVGFAVGAVSRGIVRELRGLPTLVALGASAVGVMLYAVLGAVLGESQFLHVDLAVVVAVVAIANALLAGPAVRILRWALVSAAERPVGGGSR
ncbi:MAG TPA: rod shape-determining protein MreD [Acidimicrobiales bacterium]|nr:rod shape-determining protein MreD [Acidimicrobiales bacterium]